MGHGVTQEGFIKHIKLFVLMNKKIYMAISSARMKNNAMNHDHNLMRKDIVSLLSLLSAELSSKLLLLGH